MGGGDGVEAQRSKGEDGEQRSKREDEEQKSKGEDKEQKSKEHPLVRPPLATSSCSPGAALHASFLQQRPASERHGLRLRVRAAVEASLLLLLSSAVGRLLGAVEKGAVSGQWGVVFEGVVRRDADILEESGSACALFLLQPVLSEDRVWSL